MVVRCICTCISSSQRLCASQMRRCDAEVAAVCSLGFAFVINELYDIIYTCMRTGELSEYLERVVGEGVVRKHKGLLVRH